MKTDTQTIIQQLKKCQPGKYYWCDGFNSKGKYFADVFKCMGNDGKEMSGIDIYPASHFHSLTEWTLTIEEGCFNVDNVKEITKVSNPEYFL